MDRELAADGLTARQWYLILAIERSGEEALGISDAARLAGTTRQNVKQLALKLEKKGFLRIRPNPSDGRGLLLSVTDSCRAYWAARQGRDTELLAEAFAPLDDTIEVFSSSLRKLDANLQELE